MPNARPVVQYVRTEESRLSQIKEDSVMAQSNQGAEDPNDESKQPFISQEDRPEVRLNLDTPLSELRVRELSAILGFLVGKNPNFEVGKTSLKDFFDKPFPEVAKDWLKESKIEKIEKPEKPEKLEKDETKESKFEKIEKPEKPEKLEKSELKEVKNEKLEREGVFDPRGVVGPDPRMEQVIQAVTGLTKQVSQLANQVEELRKKVSG
jgi:hypothetical protein